MGQESGFSTNLAFYKNKLSMNLSRQKQTDKKIQGFLFVPKYTYEIDSLSDMSTLQYGIMVPSGINVPLGKFGKNNKRTPWKTLR